MTDGLIEFLRAQLDTDEAHAQKDLVYFDAGSAQKWTAHYGHNLPFSEIRDADGELIGSLSSVRHQADAALVSRMVRLGRERAERALAEVQSKRLILDEAQRYSPELEHGDNGEWALGMVLRALALPYQGRPGFREEWLP
jgi:hypothetical protein